MSEAILRDVASLAIRLAAERGATDAECTIAEGDEFSATVGRGGDFKGGRIPRGGVAGVDREAAGLLVYL